MRIVLVKVEQSLNGVIRTYFFIALVKYSFDKTAGVFSEKPKVTAPIKKNKTRIYFPKKLYLEMFLLHIKYNFDNLV